MLQNLKLSATHEVTWMMNRNTHPEQIPQDMNMRCASATESKDILNFISYASGIMIFRERALWDNYNPWDSSKHSSYISCGDVRCDVKIRMWHGHGVVLRIASYSLLLLPSAISISLYSFLLKWLFIPSLGLWCCGSLSEQTWIWSLYDCSVTRRPRWHAKTWLTTKCHMATQAPNSHDIWYKTSSAEISTADICWHMQHVMASKHMH